MFVEDLFTFLSGAGTNAANRIYPSQLPQGATFPAIKYFQVSDPPEHTHDGRSILRHPRFQLDCWDEDREDHDGYLGAKQLAGQVIEAVDGYRGLIGSATCYAIFQENAQDNFDPDTNRHWVSVDIEVWHKET